MSDASSSSPQAASGQALPQQGLRLRLNTLLFEIRSPAGRLCNMTIMGLIVLSVLISMAGTMKSLDPNIREMIRQFEIAITWLFAAEYLLRIYAARRPRSYALGFYGLVDLLTILPLLLVGDPNLVLRLLRILRLVKVVRYMQALRLFLATMSDALEILGAVLGAIFLGAILAGNLVYAVEPETFPDAFAGAWWGIVTMTTVGYGDMVPHTLAGKGVAVMLMVIGISMFAMVTGVVSVKVARALHNSSKCPSCSRGVDPQFSFCPFCATRLQNERRHDFRASDSKAAGSDSSGG
ncbi:MAG: ion transporter [Mariprofundaceae bacterium]|nr:ion transporter [Mariprofundaceae bacterium]